MTVEQTAPAPDENSAAAPEVVPLRYGLCAVYILKPKPRPEVEREPWPDDAPPPWGPVGYPEGYQPTGYEQAELDLMQQQREQPW